MRVLIPLIALLAVMSAGGRANQSGVAKGDLSAELALTGAASRAPVRPGDPVPIKVILTNTSDHHILLSGNRVPGGVNYDLGFEIRDENGKTIPKRSQSIARVNSTELPINVVFTYSLAPGRTMTVDYDAGKDFNLSRKGKYTLRLTGIPVVPSPVVKSNTVTVAVTE